MSSSRADRRSGSLAGLCLCMVMHGGNSGGSRLRAGHHDLSIAEMTQPRGMVVVKVRDHDLAHLVNMKAYLLELPVDFILTIDFDRIVRRK